jgi:hypothetical protein
MKTPRKHFVIWLASLAFAVGITWFVAKVEPSPISDTFLEYSMYCWGEPSWVPPPGPSITVTITGSPCMSVLPRVEWMTLRHVLDTIESSQVVPSSITVVSNIVGRESSQLGEPSVTDKIAPEVDTVVVTPAFRCKPARPIFYCGDKGEMVRLDGDSGGDRSLLREWRKDPKLITLTASNVEDNDLAGREAGSSIVSGLEFREQVDGDFDKFDMVFVVDRDASENRGLPVCGGVLGPHILRFGAYFSGVTSRMASDGDLSRMAVLRVDHGSWSLAAVHGGQVERADGQKYLLLPVITQRCKSQGLGESSDSGGSE